MAATLAGCSETRPAPAPSHSAGPSTPSASITADMGEMGPTVEPVLVPGLTTDTSSTESQGLQIHVKWPIVPGATALNTAVASWAGGREQDFRSQAQPSSENPPEIGVSDMVFLASGQVAGVRMEEYVNYGASGATTHHTFYGGADGSWVIPGRGLFTDAAMPEVVKALLAAVPRADRAEAERLDDPFQVLDDSIVRPDGSVTIALQQGLLTAYSDGTPSVTIPDGQARGWLSAHGRDVVAAAQSPSPWAGTAAPTVSPISPTAVPPGTPAAGGVDCAVVACIALTYDDGPSRYTNTLLDHLAAAGVPATLFVVGQNVAQHADVLKRAAAMGVEVANHTWSHRDLARLAPAQARSEVDRTQAAIEAAIGIRPTLLRPPYGSFSAATKGLGLPLVNWDVDTLDWQNRNAAITTKRALAGARRGSIILMHDIHPSSVDATPGIIAALKKRGFTLVTVDQLLNGPKPGQVYFRLGR